ncbi:MAG TPA: LamG domain-containing protein [Verrucomicrobiae bacterium]
MAEFKFPCPSCGQQIQCDAGYGGSQINCPACQQSIVVPKPSQAATAPTAPAKSKAWQNSLIIGGLAIVLAGLVIGGWFGYSKIRMFINRGHLPTGVVVFWPGGIHFDGKENHMSVPNKPELNFGAGQDFSIEGWIKPLRPPPHPRDDIMTVFSKRYSPNSSVAVGYELYLAGGKAAFQLANTLNTIQNFNSAGPDLRDGNFHHVAVTVQRNSTTGLQFYVDGQVISTFDPTVVPGDLSNTSPLRIGNHPDPAYQCYFHGEIKNVAVFNRALSASEIQAIYTKQK